MPQPKVWRHFPHHSTASETKGEHRVLNALKRQRSEFWEVKAVKFTRQESAAQRKRELQRYAEGSPKLLAGY